MTNLNALPTYRIYTKTSKTPRIMKLTVKGVAGWRATGASVEEIKSC